MNRTARRLGALVPVLALAAGLQFAASPAAQSASPTVAPTGDLRLAPASTAVENSWIVVLKDGSTRAADLGATPKHVYRSALKGFSTTMSQARAARLAADPRVAYVEQDATVRVADTQTGATWGLDRIDQRDLPLSTTYTYDTTASNVTAYIIDTGIRTSHGEFGGRASVGTDTVGGGQNGQDCQGHGTHVAGTVGGAKYGVAKGVKLVAVRVLDCNGSGTTAGVIAGVDWVTANAVKPAVANMSLGGGANASLDDAVRRSIASGVTYAVAAGNGNFLGLPAKACNYSPARVAEAITVGATDSADKRASFSNYGTCVDLFAPGVSVTSAWKDNDTATNTISGTSMAAPHTAGVAALYLAANPAATPAQVGTALVNNATSGKVQDPRSGSPNKLLHSRF
ncbi:Peptidase S8 and S53 [Streptomyces venezuelae]|uniref:S8 family peptidase n=1 Tax=Streptomyces gardneri TaxID=66892 RepID=UPI0006BD861E|nr:S8 family peptidase [Streptomyces gardneri]ALO08535.1 Peptidase S8 and S53 [Streptomyces venezuelae]QPK45740.1 S8 family peptidase [Streptomyces gardneri]WRK37086.1 S8 family peptidase [Streptomyces venezuelae]CUM41097.1 Alkaline serine exoprotease A precursor [Streptomyces venezuelae]